MAVAGFVLEDEVNRAALRRERVFRDRLNPFEEPQHVLLNRYRFPKEKIEEFVEELAPLLELPTRRVRAVSPATQVAVALSIFASGGFQRGMGNLHGVSQSTASRIFNRVTDAIVNVKLREIQFPNRPRDLALTKQDFNEVWKIHSPLLYFTKTNV